MSSVSICKTLVGSLVSLQVRKNLIEQSKIISPSGIFFFSFLFSNFIEINFTSINYIDLTNYIDLSKITTP